MAKSVLLLYIAVEQFAYTVRSGYISLAERDTVKLNISSASGKPIYEQIEDQIRAAIMSGELQTGEALPSLRKLAKELHISVLTIARAYSELADEGLVENVQGKGTFVLAHGNELMKERARERIMDVFRQTVTAAKAADELLTIRGIRASFVMYRKDDGVYMSARSLGEVNVQVILEALGGGGNSTTAGGQAKGITVAEAKEKLLAAIDKYFED